MSPRPHALKTGVRLYTRIAASFIILTLVLLALVLSTTVSRARITVFSKSVPVKSDVKVTVASGLSNADTVRGLVIETTAEGSRVGKPKEGGSIVDAKATGTVLLVNKRAQSQALVATTRLLSPDGVLFRLKNGVTIPANGELKDVVVVADKVGATGEIGPTKFTIPGLPEPIQKLVYAFSEKPMTGGVITVKAVTQPDIDTTAVELTKELTANASASLTAAAREKGFGAIAVEASELSRTVSAKPGDQVDSFAVTLKLRVLAVGYDIAKLRQIGEKALAENLASELSLRTSGADHAEVKIVSASAASQSATLAAQFTGTAALNDKSVILTKERLLGLDEATVVGYLKSFDTVSDAKVNFSPFWVHHVPRIKDHVTIEVK